ncbi:hypothetical protein ADIMK_2653 [Marinobacterium lacunae]|uniref:Uncharacterized protein n=1 Tax=Marinobacterium lacunae TaxID=1232683 RepID=A0A081FX74_9GAMM|nr:hypothetical protein [Marinobacterium lacunae]KEA63129.1 hypothetical protein ADIMK_2653 [Marinobacterium lacunae]
METGVFISAAAAVIAAGAALISAGTLRKELLTQRIEAAKWKKDYFSDLTHWSDESMRLLSEALHLCDLAPTKCESPTFFDRRHQLRVNLSAQIDKGRWFFPNDATEDHGQHKEAAYRGYRPAVLDALVDAYSAVSVLDHQGKSNHPHMRKEIQQAKRIFTSEIQQVLDPQSRDKEFKKLIGQATKNG